jgi:hypothetical protein
VSRAELEARVPRWCGSAAAISKLSIGLIPPNSSAGNWVRLDLRRRGSNLAEQERAIVDRLVRRGRSAFCSVLDEYLPGR